MGKKPNTTAATRAAGRARRRYRFALGGWDRSRCERAEESG